MPTRVLVDANVLYSRTERDWLALLAGEAESLFAVYWTEDILAETIYRLRRNHPTWPGGMITTIHDKLRKAFEGGRVDDFEIDGSFPGKDQFDQHVHAAALACGAHILLTNESSFIPATVDPDDLPYELYSADDFFQLVDQATPDLTRRVVEQQLRHWCKTNGSANLPKALRESQCPQFAETVRAHLQAIGTINC